MDTRRGLASRLLPSDQITSHSSLLTVRIFEFQRPNMKALATLLLVPVALAAMLKEHQHLGSMGTGVEPIATPPGDGGNTTGPNCGVGYTYCGYILKEQKSTS